MDIIMRMSLQLERDCPPKPRPTPRLAAPCTPIRDADAPSLADGVAALNNALEVAHLADLPEEALAAQDRRSPAAKYDGRRVACDCGSRDATGYKRLRGYPSWPVPPKVIALRVAAAHAGATIERLLSKHLVTGWPSVIVRSAPFLPKPSRPSSM